jgi:uncharacterized membrane protein YhaH (DUF805 family)
MNLIENYTTVVFKNYANFTGRASRSEYWYFYLTNILIGFLFGFSSELSDLPQDISELVTNIYSLIIIIPAIAVGVRRMHDADRSGWFILVPIYNFILSIRKGTAGPNRFGTDPLANDLPVPTPSQPSTQTSDDTVIR